jgi:peptidoglycan-associated lipoprotein
MKHTKLFNLLMMLGLSLTLATVGCKKHPYGTTPIPGQTHPIGGGNLDNQPSINPAVPIDTSANPANLTGIPPTGGHENWTADPSDPLKAQTIYFDYDKTAIKASEQGKLDDVAAYMKSHGEVALRVEGNCDERGTEEYNRSLGERRALGGREYLVKLGIDATRIDTVTYGEDKPAETGHDEAAWSKNRRDDFVVLLAPKQ